jgi:hypothetical protein
MTTALPKACVLEIGETAGVVWNTLDKSGPMSLTQLLKKVKQPRDLVMQGLGWLAREEKIDIKDEGRSRIISLR